MCLWCQVSTFVFLELSFLWGPWAVQEACESWRALIFLPLTQEGPWLTWWYFFFLTESLGFLLGHRKDFLVCIPTMKKQERVVWGWGGGRDAYVWPCWEFKEHTCRNSAHHSPAVWPHVVAYPLCSWWGHLYNRNDNTGLIQRLAEPNEDLTQNTKGVNKRQSDSAPRSIFLLLLQLTENFFKTTETLKKQQNS